MRIVKGLRSRWGSIVTKIRSGPRPVAVYLIGSFLISIVCSAPSYGVTEWSKEDLRHIQESIERELESNLLRDFPELSTYTERERLALFYAFIAQDTELSRSLGLQPEDFSDRREGKVALSESEIQKLQRIADQAFELETRGLRKKLEELKMPMGLPAKFAIEGVKATVALNLAFFSGALLGLGAGPELSDADAGLRTLMFLSTLYVAALPIRLPMVLQKHYEKLEAVKSARATAARTHQISPAMNRLWFLSKELRFRMRSAQGVVRGNQCSSLFTPSIYSH